MWTEGTSAFLSWWKSRSFPTTTKSVAWTRRRTAANNSGLLLKAVPRLTTQGTAVGSRQTSFSRAVSKSWKSSAARREPTANTSVFGTLVNKSVSSDRNKESTWWAATKPGKTNELHSVSRSTKTGRAAVRKCQLRKVWQSLSFPLKAAPTTTTREALFARASKKSRSCEGVVVASLVNKKGGSEQTSLSVLFSTANKEKRNKGTKVSLFSWRTKPKSSARPERSVMLQPWFVGSSTTSSWLGSSSDFSVNTIDKKVQNVSQQALMVLAITGCTTDQIYVPKRVYVCKWICQVSNHVGLLKRLQNLRKLFSSSFLTVSTTSYLTYLVLTCTYKKLRKWILSRIVPTPTLIKPMRVVRFFVVMRYYDTYRFCILA